MIFVKVDRKVKRIRTTGDNTAEPQETVVAEFDDVIDIVAPHVAASIMTDEIDPLYTWVLAQELNTP